MITKKKIRLIASAILFFGVLNAQTNIPPDIPRQEVKITVTNLIFGRLDPQYEYLINEESSAGISALVNAYTDFALGLSIGGKLLSKRGFVSKIYFGVGRPIFGAEFAPQFLFRGGVSLGYRI